jgi:hypothetical protein
VRSEAERRAAALARRPLVPPVPVLARCCGESFTSAGAIADHFSVDPEDDDRQHNYVLEAYA